MSESPIIEYFYVQKSSTEQGLGKVQSSIHFRWTLYAILMYGSDLDYILEYKFPLGKKHDRFLLKCEIKHDVWKKIIKVLGLVRNISTEKSKFPKHTKVQSSEWFKTPLGEVPETTKVALAVPEVDGLGLETRIFDIKKNMLSGKIPNERTDKELARIVSKEVPGSEWDDDPEGDTAESFLETLESKTRKILHSQRTLEVSEIIKEMSSRDAVVSKIIKGPGRPPKSTVSPPSIHNKKDKPILAISDLRIRTAEEMANFIQKNYNWSDIFETISKLYLWDFTIRVIYSHLEQINQELWFNIIDKLKEQLKSELKKKFGVYTLNYYVCLDADIFDVLGYMRLWLILGREVSKPLSINDRIELAEKLWYLE